MQDPALMPDHVVDNPRALFGAPRMTHARPVTAQTMNHGLKLPCQCGSGKKFKHCCFSRPTRGWGWFALGERDYAPICIESGDLADCPVIIVHPVYQTAIDYITRTGMREHVGQGVCVVRMAIEDLATYIDQMYPPGHRLMIVAPPECSLDGQGLVYEIETGKGVTA